MTASNANTGLQLCSLVTHSGELELSLKRVPIPTPLGDEVIIRVLATPINPSDLGLLFGPADLTTARESGTKEEPVLTATIPERAMVAMASRLDEAMVVGNEGAGVVVSAGSSPEAQALIGKTVATFGGGMYTQYRCAQAAQCLVLPADLSPAEGASCFVNPLTTLCFIDILKRDGQTAMVHTAAASNLGQMLLRICLKDGIRLINVVRTQAQEDLLRGMGATYVLNSGSPGFAEDLTRCLSDTGATTVFDAVGGGKLGGQILACMEAAQASRLTAYARYGSTVHKQLYIYGNFDTGPTLLNRGKLGAAWSVSGFLMMPYLQKIGVEATRQMQRRVLAELKTTFASYYTREISLADALRLAEIARYSRRTTGEKFLINPNKDVV